MSKIVTSNVFPPIPDRTMDWCAYYDGDEESGPRGWGATEAEAIADLKDNYDDPTPEPCSIAAVRDGCICRMQNVNTATIDPPEAIINPRCPVHTGYDVDDDMDRRREDAEMRRADERSDDDGW